MTPATLVVNRLQWLSEQTFEMGFERPRGFGFAPGQKVSLVLDGISREYTLVNGLDDGELTICVRRVNQGRFSPVLARAVKGDRIQASSAFGHFVHQPTAAMPVFVATGTGVAPFVSYARSGVSGFYLLHGVQTPDDLYYRSTLKAAAHRYVACLSQGNASDYSKGHAFNGRVTTFLKSKLPKGVYDFYLCGRGEMVAEATSIIDRQFEGSKIFTERYY